MLDKVQSSVGHGWLTGMHHPPALGRKSHIQARGAGTTSQAVRHASSSRRKFEDMIEEMEAGEIGAYPVVFRTGNRGWTIPLLLATVSADSNCECIFPLLHPVYN